MLIIAKNRKNYPEFPSFLFVRFLTKTSGTLEARSERSLRLCNNKIILGLLEGDRLDAHVFRPEESDQAVTRDWTDVHLDLGIRAMTEIAEQGEPIKHFTF